MKIGTILLLVLAVIFYGAGILFAEYTVVLKNGRRITIKGYREETGRIMIYGLGGEFGISKDQIKEIIRSEEVGERGMDIQAAERQQGAVKRDKGITAPGVKPKVEKKGEPVADKEKLSPEEKLKQQRAEEEKKYQDKVGKITENIKKMMDRYSVATRGKAGSDPSLLEGKEAIDARTADLLSRMKDARRNPGKPTPLIGSSGGRRRSGPKRNVVRRGQTYSKKEKELSSLRKQIDRLRQEKKRIIKEMKAKKFDTRSLSSNE